MEILLSTSKRGYGLRELLSNNNDDFWSSDSNLPHSITIRFHKMKFVHKVSLLLYFSKDDSYTPECIKYFYNGISKEETFTEPEGYVDLPINEHIDEVEIVIMSNHTDGKDSHVHNVRVHKTPDDIYHF